MNIFRGSLGARLAWGAAIFIALALAIAGIGIGFVLHRFVVVQLDQRLDGQISTIAAALRGGGDGLRLSRYVDAPPFDRPMSGWYWEVRNGGRHLASQSLDGGDLTIDAAHGRWQDVLLMRAQPAEGTGPRGEPLHLRMAPVTIGGKVVTIVASAPEEAIARPMRQALTPLALSLLLLGIALTAAILLQVRLGLRPLRAMQADVAAVRTGRADSLPRDQPRELQPLAEELNTLLAQNAAGLERARRSAANLAHALKTPLATLGASLGKDAVAANRDLLVEIDRMERQIRHHLRRARAAALDGPVRARTVLAGRIDDLAAVLGKIHADKGIDFRSTSATDIAVACEPQDLDEILGNVLDNAFKWARSTVSAGVVTEDGFVAVSIDDDGPGLRDDQLLDVMLPGRRLDESVAGDGFGLAITRELAELYSGGIDIARSGLGGVRVRVTLPVAA